MYKLNPTICDALVSDIYVTNSFELQLYEKEKCEKIPDIKTTKNKQKYGIVRLTGLPTLIEC